MNETGPPSIGWKCPKCGRRFVRRTREHSCIITTLESHLERTTPEMRDAFRVIQEFLGSLGPNSIVPLKGMVVFSTNKNFGGATFLKSSIDLGFFLPYQLRHERIHKIERLSAWKFAHHVRISSVVEVDEEIEQWLRVAYSTSVDDGSE